MDNQIQRIMYLRTTLVGKRIQLDHLDDPFTELVAGDKGTVQLVDDFGTIHVKWDSGSSLGLVEEAGDRFHQVEESEASV